MDRLVWKLRQRRTFQGGLFLPDEKALTARKPIEQLPTDAPLDVPAQLSPGLPTRILVHAGQIVAMGEILAEAASDESLSVRSPVDGRIVEIGRAWTARGGFAPSIRIEPAGAREPRRALAPLASGGSTLRDVAELARSAGVVGLDGAPLHVSLGTARDDRIDTLIVNAMETEPNLTCDLRLLVERSADLVATIDWLAGIESGEVFRNVILAVALRHGRIVRQLHRRAAAASRRIRVVALEDKYPQCHPSLICKVLLGREPGPGSDARELGALIVPLATLAALAEACEGRPCVSRVLTVSGDAVEQPGNLNVPFGTPIQRLIEHVGLRRRPLVALAGGPMTGIPLPDVRAVTTPDMAGLTLLSRLPRGAPIACVRCGWCVEDCPAGIDPRALSQLELKEDFSDSERYSLAACIECGICTYVCPSQLPLAEAIRQCRGRLEESAAGSA